MAQLGCQWKYAGLCVTNVQYENFTCAANLSKQLSSYLLGNGTGEFDTKMEQLRVAIVTVNSTRVDAGLATGIVIMNCCRHESSKGVGRLGSVSRPLGLGLPGLPVVYMQDQVFSTTQCSHDYSSLYGH